jgi:hypothetical protein
MTAAILPEFIMSVLEKELSKIVIDVVHVVCEEYGLNHKEVKQKLSKHMHIKLDIDTDSNYKVIKKKVVKIKATPENQCIANILCKDQKDIRQCTFRRADGCMFCVKHHRANVSNTLKYGTVEKPNPVYKRS